MSCHPRLVYALVAIALAMSVPAARAHDPSAWGGLFRSRDDGAAWLPADAGLFVGGALAVAVSPADASHLLYATDTRLLRSRNGGRDWAQEAPEIFHGPTLAVAFDRTGSRMWAATPAGIFVASDGGAWRKSTAPEIAIPGRALVPGFQPGRVYLLGARGVYASLDGGETFGQVGKEDLPDGVARALAVSPAGGETLFVVLEGRVWASADAGKSWAPCDAQLPIGRVETIAADPVDPRRLWVATDTQLYLSADLAKSWKPWGAPLAAASVSVRGLAIAQNGRVIVLTTHKGLLRSSDAGASWTQVEGSLPVHLEAGPLVRDPHDAQTLYAGFALVPYGEIRRSAEQGSNLLSQVDPVSLAGAAAFLLLLLIGGWLGARKLAGAYRGS